jgi:hypothetical protein
MTGEREEQPVATALCPARCVIRGVDHQCDRDHTNDDPPRDHHTHVAGGDLTWPDYTGDDTWVMPIATVELLGL